MSDDETARLIRLEEQHRGLRESFQHERGELKEDIQLVHKRISNMDGKLDRWVDGANRALGGHSEAIKTLKVDVREANKRAWILFGSVSGLIGLGAIAAKLLAG